MPRMTPQKLLADAIAQSFVNGASVSEVMKRFMVEYEYAHCLRQELMLARRRARRRCSTSCEEKSA